MTSEVTYPSGRNGRIEGNQTGLPCEEGWGEGGGGGCKGGTGACRGGLELCDVPN